MVEKLNDETIRFLLYIYVYIILLVDKADFRFLGKITESKACPVAAEGRDGVDSPHQERSESVLSAKN